MLAARGHRAAARTSQYALSNFFVVPKKGGQWRGVLNLHWVNTYIEPHHFKMEGLKDVRSLVRKGDWMTSIDLHSAFWHIPVHPDHRRWLAFETPRGIFQFAVMPFGVSCAPRIFTKLMRDVVALLRRQGVRMVIYLDDMLILASSKEESRRHTLLALRLLFELGLAINTDKSALTPSRTSEFLGFLIDTRRMHLYVPAAKRRQISDEARNLLDRTASSEPISCRELARFLGRARRWPSPCATLSCTGTHFAPASLALNHHQHWKGAWCCPLRLSRSCGGGSATWTWNGRALLTPRRRRRSSRRVQLGWAAFVEGSHLFARGFWTPLERTWSTNARELRTIVLALRAFQRISGPGRTL